MPGPMGPFVSLPGLLWYWITNPCVLPRGIYRLIRDGFFKPPKDMFN